MFWVARSIAAMIKPFVVADNGTRLEDGENRTDTREFPIVTFAIARSSFFTPKRLSLVFPTPSPHIWANSRSSKAVNSGLSIASRLFALPRLLGSETSPWVSDAVKLAEVVTARCPSIVTNLWCIRLLPLEPSAVSSIRGIPADRSMAIASRWPISAGVTLPSASRSINCVKSS